MKHQKLEELERVIACDYHNVAGIVVQKNNEFIYQNYFNQCNENSRIHIYSVSKSIVSLLIGMAVDKGYIKSVNQRILDFFPEYKVKKKEKTIQHITVKDLLTMTAPYKYKDGPFAYIRYFMSDDGVKFALDLLGGKGQIGEFRYTPLIGPDILSGILVKATGRSVFEFATENLFTPLEITVQRSVMLQTAKEQSVFNKATDISGWVIDAKGVNTGGWGLTLSAVDMAKIGQLCLNNGIWNGEQIVSKEWIDACTKEHSRWEENELSFGYLWWINDAKERAYAAMGDGGNVIYVNKQKNIVVSIASLLMQNAKDRIELIKKYIEPAVDELLS